MASLPVLVPLLFPPRPGGRPGPLLAVDGFFAVDATPAFRAGRPLRRGGGGEADFADEVISERSEREWGRDGTVDGPAVTGVASPSACRSSSRPSSLSGMASVSDPTGEPSGEEPLRPGQRVEVVPDPPLPPKPPRLEVATKPSSSSNSSSGDLGGEKDSLLPVLFLALPPLPLWLPRAAAAVGRGADLTGSSSSSSSSSSRTAPSSSSSSSESGAIILPDFPEGCRRGKARLGVGGANSASSPSDDELFESADMRAMLQGGATEGFRGGEERDEGGRLGLSVAERELLIEGVGRGRRTVRVSGAAAQSEPRKTCVDRPPRTFAVSGSRWAGE